MKQSKYLHFSVTGCKYPYEAPYFYIYKNDRKFPRINCLRIARKLHDHALLLANEGTPSLFSTISLLEYENDVKTYLEENKEQFLDQYEPLFPKERESEEERASHYKLGNTNKKNRDCVSWEEIIKEDDLIEKRFKEKQKNANYRKMKETRKKLPVWSNMTKILESVQQNQVVIISGETGCGKSTQVHSVVLSLSCKRIYQKKENNKNVDANVTGTAIYLRRVDY